MNESNMYKISSFHIVWHYMQERTCFYFVILTILSLRHCLQHNSLTSHSQCCKFQFHSLVCWLPLSNLDILIKFLFELNTQNALDIQATVNNEMWHHPRLLLSFIKYRDWWRFIAGNHWSRKCHIWAKHNKMKLILAQCTYFEFLQQLELFACFIAIRARTETFC